MNLEIGIDICALPFVKQIARGNLLYSPGSSTRGSVVTQMDGRGGVKSQSEGIYVYIQLIHFVVQQKLIQHCSLQHLNILSPLDTSTTGCHFHFGSASSFLLELFLHSSLVTHWTPTNLGGGGGFTVQYHIFLPFYTLHGILKARMLKWFAIPFSNGPCFVRTLHYDQSVLGGPIKHCSQLH